MYYQVKVKIKTIDERGKQKTSIEQFIAEAESVTEVEAKMYTEYEGFDGDWTVDTVKETKIIKIIE